MSVSIHRRWIPLVISIGAVFAAHADGTPGAAVKPEPYAPGKTLTRSVQAGITPEGALAILKDGNARFVAGKPLARNVKAQVTQTALGQYPFASVVACIDSRSAPEQVFDLGIGDVFTSRVAGNTVNEDILGSLEYASKYAGSRLIVVLGHTSCGAIKGACDGLKDPAAANLTSLLGKYAAAVSAAKTPGERSSKNYKFVAEVTEINVAQTVEAIRARSPTLKGLEAEGKLKIVGAVYDTSSGKVLWQ